MTGAGYIDLWLTLPEVAAEWAGELLCELGSQGAVETPAGDGLVRVLGSVPEQRLDAARARLEQRIVEALGAGVLESKPEVGSQRTAEVDWQSVMRHHHQPFRVADVLVRPPWSEPAAGPEVVLEPGMAFGTGSHETTRLCLEALADELAARHRVRRLLDVGTGTGILALVALRLSSSLEAVACDVDPDAIEYARNAARHNGLDARLDLRLGRLEPAWGPFDLVVANLQWNVFPSEIEALAAALGPPPARLVCSGLLLEQEAGMGQLAAGAGLRCEGRAERGEWCLLRFARRADAQA